MRPVATLHLDLGCSENGRPRSTGSARLARALTAVVASLLQRMGKLDRMWPSAKPGSDGEVNLRAPQTCTPDVPAAPVLEASWGDPRPRLEFQGSLRAQLPPLRIFVTSCPVRGEDLASPVCVMQTCRGSRRPLRHMQFSVRYSGPNEGRLRL
ncbi:hypothetical protein NDU88_000888 [Pleurodeles waltl]|uniref:Uncharacterized protein n=1 Tax=Pleurodeles waltl TaxID=8319 RepID=A0AAV7ML13_PLEWA|nr:hypothetical protein NDU88_000888 [Pleurodeles waltl]